MQVNIQQGHFVLNHDAALLPFKFKYFIYLKILLST